jgi:serine/threonine-protein kinase RsbW
MLPTGVIMPDGSDHLNRVSRLADVADESPRITLSFPGSPEYLRLARLASADVGSRVGFDYEDIDDLRIAVSELCNLITGVSSTAPVTVEFTLHDDAVSVVGHSVMPGEPAPDNEFSRAIVSAVVDEHEVFADPEGGSRFRLVKRRRVTPRTI